ISVASTSTGSALTIQSGAATASGNAGGNLLLQGGAGGGSAASGSVIVKSNGNNSTSAFEVQDASANAVLVVDTVNGLVGIGGTPSASGGRLQVNGGVEITANGNFSTVNGALTLGGTNVAGFVTPGGSTIPTKINVPIYNPGAF